jgi:hypothetical protein
MVGQCGSRSQAQLRDIEDTVIVLPMLDDTLLDNESTYMAGQCGSRSQAQQGGI